ncbi:MAG: C4-type zinc ribbon domain-containing protein [Anaerolineales bacterium]
MSTLSLYRLQQLDSRLDQIQRRLDEIRRQMQEDRRYHQAHENLQARQAQWETARSARHNLEYEVSAQRIKIAQAEAALYGGKIHNPKELQDLEREIAALKRHLSVLEERLLEAMIQEEEEERALHAAQEEMKAVENALATEHSLLLGEMSRLEQETQRLQVERQVALQGVDERLLAEYESLRSMKRGLAVAAVSEGACAACGTLLTPAQQQQARQLQQIFHCPNCGRILYAG